MDAPKNQKMTGETRLRLSGLSVIEQQCQAACCVQKEDTMISTKWSISTQVMGTEDTRSVLCVQRYRLAQRKRGELAIVNINRLIVGLIKALSFHQS